MTAPAIEAAYAPVKRSIAAAAHAATLGASARLIRAEVLPQLRTLLQAAEAVRPGTVQLAAIHHACLAALRDAITEYALLADAFQSTDASAFARAKTVGLLRLKLGDGIPMTP